MTSDDHNAALPLRLAVLVYGAICYVIAMGALVYGVGFIGGFYVGKTLDGGAVVPTHQALFINMTLLVLFAVQHSVMARPRFKEWLAGWLPAAAERSTFVLFSGLVLIVLYYLWAPMPAVVWQFDSGFMQVVMWLLYASGWGLLVYSSFLINHFDLFGLRHVWLFYRQQPYQLLPFVTPGPYRWVRHPLYLGWLVLVWSTPVMTAGHLLFAAVTSLYVFIGLRFEERDLIRHFDADYEQYRRSTPMIMPGFKRRPVD